MQILRDIDVTGRRTHDLGLHGEPKNGPVTTDESYTCLIHVVGLQ